MSRCRSGLIPPRDSAHRRGRVELHRESGQSRRWARRGSSPPEGSPAGVGVLAPDPGDRSRAEPRAHAGHWASTSSSTKRGGTSSWSYGLGWDQTFGKRDVRRNLGVLPRPHGAARPTAPTRIQFSGCSASNRRTRGRSNATRTRSSGRPTSTERWAGAWRCPSSTATTKRTSITRRSVLSVCSRITCGRQRVVPRGARVPSRSGLFFVRCAVATTTSVVEEFLRPRIYRQARIPLEHGFLDRSTPRSVIGSPSATERRRLKLPQSSTDETVHGLPEPDRDATRSGSHRARFPSPCRIDGTILDQLTDKVDDENDRRPRLARKGLLPPAGGAA